MVKVKLILLAILAVISVTTFVKFGFTTSVALVYALIGLGILALKPLR